MGHGYRVVCPRCGGTREGRARDKGKLCRDCYYVEPDWPDSVLQQVQVLEPASR